MATLMPSLTKPFMPAEPSSVHRISSSQHARELVAPENQILGAETEHADHVGATFLEAARLGIDRRHAQAAADAHHLFRAADRARDAHRSDDAVERGPRPGRSAASPWWSCRPPARPGSSVPSLRSKSAMVSGMRSPACRDITMTNCPGLAALAISGWTNTQRECDAGKVVSRYNREVCRSRRLVHRCASSGFRLTLFQFGGYSPEASARHFHRTARRA